MLGVMRRSAPLLGLWLLGCASRIDLETTHVAVSAESVQQAMSALDTKTPPA